MLRIADGRCAINVASSNSDLASNSTVHKQLIMFWGSVLHTTFQGRRISGLGMRVVGTSYIRSKTTAYLLAHKI